MPLKFYQYSKSRFCYFCDAPSSTAEHVPPKMLFKGVEIDSITVPSCENHNTSKGNVDQALLVGMAMGRNQTIVHGLSKLPHELVASIKLMVRGQKSVKKQVNLEKLIANPPDELEIDMPYLANARELFEDWVRQIAAGLLWPVIGQRDPAIQWDEASVWGADLWTGDRERSFGDAITMAFAQTGSKAALDHLSWAQGWGPQGTGSFPKHLFRFDLVVSPKRESGLGPVAFRLRFFDAYTWYILFQASNNTIEAARAWTGLT